MSKMFNLKLYFHFRNKIINYNKIGCDNEQ